jgi:hypothetical protein
MSISPNDFVNVKTLTLHWTPDGRITPGLFLTTGVAIISFKGTLTDWTRENLEFVVPSVPTFDPETRRPII